MFTMAKIRDGSTYLGQHLTSNDYYCENESVSGRWVGRSAERLGLRGEIHADDAAFERLRQNRHPVDDTKLTPRDGDGRVRFYDFQCSAQKSVSIMAVTMGDTRLLEAHDHAAELAFGELERFAATQANTVLQRGSRTTGNVAAAVFRHTASRALDPQVHSHFVVANATWDTATNSWRALTEFEMVRAIRYAGKVYQNELAKHCRQLGYETETSRDARGNITGFEIMGVPREVRERFSKRRAEVERGISEFHAAHGRAPTSAEIHAITVRSRDPKLAEITTPAVLAAQRSQLSEAEWNALSGLRETAVTQGPLDRGPTRERESLRLAAGHLYERRSVAAGHEILAEALNQNLGYVDIDTLYEAARRGRLVALGEQDWPMELFTTRRGLRLEKWSVEFVRRTKGTCHALGDSARVEFGKLSEEQSAAVNAILESRDQVVCLRGAAGVGKTTTLKALHQNLIRSGHRVHVCAPTTSAADTLRHDGMTLATTVAGFLTKDALQADVHGAVLIVDEAGLTSNQQGAEILQIAERNGARVIFLGDSRQHTSVEAGDFLRILERHSPLQRVEMTDIRRQTVSAYREAIRDMAVGSPRTGLERLDQLGWVHEGQANYLRAAVEDYLRAAAGGERLDAVIAVTPTWEETDAFTTMLRSELKAGGRLRSGEILPAHDPQPWTKTQLARAATYAPGLVVRFDRTVAGFRRGTFVEVTRVEAGRVWVSGSHGERPLPLVQSGFSVAKARPLEVCAGDKLLVRANDRAAGLINGQMLTATSVKDGVIQTKEGPQIDTRRFRSFTHGFAVTSHRSQSKTADHVVVAAARLDAKSAYVACSRGRLSCVVHTPDKSALLERLPQGDRPAALDFAVPESSGTTANRANLWERTDTHHEADSRSPEHIHAALKAPWWRRLVRSVADWSRRAPRHRTVDAAPINRASTLHYEP